MQDKRRLNFALQWQKSNQAAYQKELNRRRWILGMVAALISLLLAGSPWIWAYQLQVKFDKTNRDIKALASIDSMWQKANRLISQADVQTKTINHAKSISINPQATLDKIMQLLPSGTSINSCVLQRDSLNLQVTSSTPVDVAHVWENLQNSRLFVNVDIQTLSLQNKEQTLNFNLKFNQANPDVASGRQ